MIIYSHRKSVSAPVAQKQPEPQPIVEKKPEKKEEIKKVSSQNKVKKILEEIEEEVLLDE
jgi:hypothetical protein